MTLLHDGISSLYCIDQPTRDVVSVHVVDEVDKAEEGCRRPLALQRRCLPLPQAHPAYTDPHTATISRLTINVIGSSACDIRVSL